METDTALSDDGSAAHALTTAPAGTVLTVGPFALTVTGVIPRTEFSFDEWEAALHWVQTVNGAVQFWLGDLLEMGEARWGEKYSQVLEATDFENKTLRNAAWVARQIPPERRRHPERLSYSHHAEVAALDPEQQEYWMTRAETDKLTRDQLRTAIRQAKLAQEGYSGEYWLLVKCANEKDQVELAEKMRNEGRTVKPK